MIKLFHFGSVKPLLTHWSSAVNSLSFDDLSLLLSSLFMRFCIVQYLILSSCDCIKKKNQKIKKSSIDSWFCYSVMQMWTYWHIYYHAFIQNYKTLSCSYIYGFKRKTRKISKQKNVHAWFKKKKKKKRNVHACLLRKQLNFFSIKDFHNW